MGAIAKRLVGGLSAAAERDNGAASEAEFAALLVVNCKLAFDADRSVADRGDFCHHPDGSMRFMPFVDISSLRVIERLPGWRGRYFHSANMTFAHYDFVRGATIHEHFHAEEEVYQVIEGELELTIDGVAEVVRPGLAGIVPANVRHSVKALTDGRAIIVDSPVRRGFD
jgi:quercetin dioxygenase-like cupin family protein